MKKILRMITAILIAFMGIGNAAHAQSDITGYWKPQESNSIVEIVVIQEGQLEGTIAWFDASKAPKGTILKDKENPNKNLRNRDLIGLPMLEKLEWKDGAWSGPIYSPKNGRTAEVRITLKSENELEVKVRFRGFRRSQVWTRTVLE